MATKKSETMEHDTFSKEQLVKSERFKQETDLLTALLEDNQFYTMAEVEKRIHDFKKGKVN